MNPSFTPKAVPEGPPAFLSRRSPLTFWRYILLLGMLLVAALLPRYARAATYTIGTGSTSAYQFPINANYGYAYSQSIYLASDMVAAGATSGTPGYISSISFNISYYPYDFLTYNKDWVIYMGNTGKSSFSSSTDWISSSSMTKVFDGTISPSTTGWFTITLSTPFYWDGSSNIAVGVDENTYWYVYDNCYFAATSRSGTRSICYYNDYSNPDPTSPPTSGSSFVTMSGTPDVKFDYTPATPCSGSMVGGSTVTPSTTLCGGATAVFSVSGSSVGTGITYEWESSPTGLAGSWTTISGATSATLSIVPGSGTTYYRRKITCAATPSSDYSTPVAVSVVPLITPPYTEDFESSSGANIPCASYSGTWGDYTYWYIRSYAYCYSTNHTPGGSKYLFAGWYYYSTPEFWFTPGISLSSGKTYRFSYWYINDGYAYYNPYTEAFIGTSQNKSAMTSIGPTVYSTSTTYQQYITDFSVPTTGAYYLGIKVRSTGSCDWGFDDLNLIELPNCNTATSLGKGGKAAATPGVICSVPGSTTLSLTGTPAYSGLTFAWEVASGTPTSFSSAGITAATGSYSISTGGTYYFRCKISCPASGLSTYSDTVKVLTTPITPPYVEDFEGAVVPNNLPCASYSPSGYWSSPGYYWSTANSGSPSSYVENHTTGGSKLLLAGGYLGIATSSSGEAYWFSPGLSLTAGKAYDVSFWYKSAGDSWYDSYGYQLGLAYGSSQSASAMTPLDDTTQTHADMRSWKQFKRGFVATSTSVQYIGILVNSASYMGYGVNIDDIGVSQLPPCAAKPVAGKAVAKPAMICSSGSTVVTTKGTSAASDLSFQWQSSTTGLAGSWSNVTGGSGGTTPAYTTPTLTTGPVYYRCVVTCGLIAAPNSDTSTSVKVNVGPVTPPYIEDFETGTPGVNMPCASYTGVWSGGSATDYFYGWSIKNKPGSAYSSYNITVDNHTPGGKFYLSAGYYVGPLYWGSYDGDRQYWFSPGIQLSGGGMAYKFNYWYVNNTYPYSSTAIDYGMYYGTSQSASAMVPVRADVRGETNSAYKEISGTLRPASNGVYYLGVKVKALDYGSQFGTAIDDIGLNQLPLCTGKPAAGVVNASPARICTSGSSSLSLKGTTEASMIEFQWQESATGTSGWANVTGGSGATNDIYTTASLSASRWYRCIVTCSVVGAPNKDTTAPFKMNVGPLDPPYVEDFETTLPGNNALCAAFSSTWGSATDPYYSTVRGTSHTGYITVDNHTPGGKNMLWLGYSLAYYGTNYWWTPGINLKKDSSYQFSYWYNGSGYPYGGTGGTLGMYYGTSQSSGAMVAIRPDVNNINISAYKQMIGRFVSSGTGVYYFGIKVNMPSYMPYGLAIDDIGIDQLPACTGAPTVGTVSVAPSMLCSAGGTAALDMDLGGVSKVAGLSYTWYSSTTGPTGPWTAMSGAMTSPSFTTPGLPSTTWFYCEVKCTQTGDFTNSSVMKVDVGVITPPYIETFETNIPGSNMPCASYTGYWSGPAYAWSINNSPVSASYPTADNHTPGGSKYLQAGYALGYSWGWPGPQYWFSPAIRFTGGKLYQFTFWYNGPGTSSAGITSTIGAYYGTTQSAAGMTTSFGTDMVINQFAYKMYKKQFTPSTTGNYYIGIKVENSPSYAYPGVSIDDIGLQEVPPCSAPVAAGTIVADPGHICASGGSTVLDLEGTTLATGLTYEWMSATSPAGPYTLTSGTGVPYNTDPLTTNTWFRAIVTCTASGAKDTSAAFKVGVGGMSVPYVEDFEKWSPGQKPTCSDATYWGSWTYDGWKLLGASVSGIQNHTPGGKNFMMAGYYLGCYGYYSPMTDDNYWFTPGLELDSRYKYAFSFWYQGNASYTHRVGAFYGKSQSVGGMTNTLMTFRKIKTSTQTQFDTIFKPASSGTYYIGLKKATESLGTWEYSGVGYDDINLNYAPCDGMPFTGSIRGSVTSGTPVCVNTFIELIDTGATINLVPGIKYQWLRRAAGSSGTWSSVMGATDTVLKSDTLIGFEYKFAVICSNTNDTAYSSVFQLPALPAHPPVVISPATSPVSYCLGDTVKFNATGYTGGVYDWMIDSVVQYGWKFSDMGATEPGEYMVRVTSPLSPCPAYSNKVKLEINEPGYSVEITKPGDSIICEGSSMMLTALASKSGVTIKWRKNNVDIPFATGSSYMVTTTGYYRAVASDGSSLCPAVSRNVHIIVKPNPDAEITVPGGTLTACENEGVVLKANAGYSYEWLRSGSTMSGSVDDSLVVKNSGAYSVKVRTADGCMDVSSPVTVNILPSPKPVITKTILGSGSVELSTTTFLDWQWSRNGSEISGAVGQTLSLILNGTYTVTVTGTNSCEGTSDPIEIDESTLSIGNTGVQTEQIRIYPNPTQSKVFIESPVAVRVSVKDITGKTVLQSQEVKEVDLSKYADGVYLFTISDKDGNELIRQQRVTKFTK